MPFNSPNRLEGLFKVTLTRMLAQRSGNISKTVYYVKAIFGCYYEILIKDHMWSIEASSFMTSSDLQGHFSNFMLSICNNYQNSMFYLTFIRSLQVVKRTTSG